MPHQLRIGRIAYHACVQELQHGDGLGQLEFRRLDALDLGAQHLRDHPPYVAPGHGVVADVGHPGRGQVLAAQSHQGVAHGFRHPRIKSMCGNEVERDRSRFPAAQVGDLQEQVVQAQLRAQLLAARYRLVRKVHADETRIGVGQRQRKQVGAIAAAHFKVSAAARGGRRQAMQPGDRRQHVRMGLGARMARVVDHVVRAIGLGRGVGRYNGGVALRRHAGSPAPPPSPRAAARA